MARPLRLSTLGWASAWLVFACLAATTVAGQPLAPPPSNELLRQGIPQIVVSQGKERARRRFRLEQVLDWLETRSPGREVSQ